MKILVTNVKWDIEEYSKKEQKEILASIPESFFALISDDTDYDDVEDEVSDVISDEFGFCHNGFDYEIVK